MVLLLPNGKYLLIEVLELGKNMVKSKMKNKKRVNVDRVNINPIIKGAHK